MKILWLWHPALPSTTNRDLIQAALEQIAQSLYAKSSIFLELPTASDNTALWNLPTLERVLPAIDELKIAVVDVSFLTSEHQYSSHSIDILFLLGYIFRKRGTIQLVFVQNAALAPHLLLPSALVGIPLLTYNLSEAFSEKQHEVALCEIVLNLEDIFRSVVLAPPSSRTMNVGKVTLLQGLLGAVLDIHPQRKTVEWRWQLEVSMNMTVGSSIGTITLPFSRCTAQATIGKVITLSKTHPLFVGGIEDNPHVMVSGEHVQVKGRASLLLRARWWSPQILIPAERGRGMVTLRPQHLNEVWQIAFDLSPVPTPDMERRAQWRVENPLSIYIR